MYSSTEMGIFMPYFVSGEISFLLGPKGCGKSSVAMELADAMEMDYFGFDMGQAFKPRKCLSVGWLSGMKGKPWRSVPNFSRLSLPIGLR